MRKAGLVGGITATLILGASMLYRHRLIVLAPKPVVPILAYFVLWKTSLSSDHVNWVDVIVGTAILAIVPFVLAAYGGHLAAETITDLSLRRRTKLKFWGLCFVGVGLAFYQQYRASQSDAEKDQRATFVQDLILTQLKGLHDQGTTVPQPSGLLVPPKPTEADRRQRIIRALRSEYIISNNNLSSGLLSGAEQLPSEWVNRRLKELGEAWTVADNSAAKPDVSMSLVDKKLPHLLVLNNSSVVANNPKYSVILWNLDSTSTSPLQIPVVTTQDYINARNAIGPNQFLEQVSNAYKEGDRLFGYIMVTCVGCIGKSYWTFIRISDGGWYSYMGDGKYASNDVLFRELPQIKADVDNFVRDVPIASRVNIEDRLIRPTSQ